MMPWDIDRMRYSQFCGWEDHIQSRAAEAAAQKLKEMRASG